MKSNFYAPARVLALAIILVFSFAVKKVNAQQYLTTIDGWNAYVHLPDEYYDSVGKTYPLICFMPGLGEIGTDASKMLVYGPSKFIAQGHNMQFMVNGRLEKPIVISLQPSAAWPGAAWLNRKLDSVMARFRIDQQRVNMTGLSMGGWAWANYVDNYNPAYTRRITSMVTLSALEPDNTIGNMKYYPLTGGTGWFFEGNTDLRGYDRVRDTMNKSVRASARYTLYNGGHCCWNTFYDPSWTENGESIYTWMLKQRRALINGPAAPVAFAGNDSTTLNTIVNLNLNGYGNDPNGLPVSFAWSKISGPALGTITLPNLLQTPVSGLILGSYKFELKVTNALGVVAKDTVTVNNGINILPVVLTDFSAKAKDKSTVSVQWKTSAEINFDYFIVERSDNPQSFNEGARVASRGDLNRGAPYYYTDLFPVDGLNFYRLKMVDKDGQVAYSEIASVNFKKELSSSIAISSAYAGDSQVQLKLSSVISQPAVLSIVDAHGKKLFSGNISLVKGINDINKNVYLPMGVYYVNLNAGAEFQTKAFIRK